MIPGSGDKIDWASEEPVAFRKGYKACVRGEMRYNPYRDARGYAAFWAGWKAAEDEKK